MKTSCRCTSLVLLVLVMAGMVGCSREAKRDRHFNRAEKYFAAERYEEALIEYQNVMRLDPTNRTALLRLARIFAEQGSPLRAMQVLQAADLKPDDPILRCRIAEFRLVSGDRTTGRNELVALVSQSPTNSEALRLLANSATTPQDITNTMVYLRQFEPQCSNSAPWLLANATLLTKLSQIEPAERLVQRALQLDSKLAQAHVQMAQILLLRSNVPAAELSFSNAVQLSRYRSPIRLADAQRKAATGKRDEARAALKDVLKAAPDYLPASLLLATIETQDQKLDEALALTGRVVSRDPLNLEARQLRSQLYVAKQQPEKAAVEWEQFDQSLKPIPFIKLQVARAYLANRDTVKAAAVLDQVILLSSNRLDTVGIEAQLLHARLDLLDRKPTDAVESLRQLLSRTNVLDARVLLIDAQRGAGRLNDAVATCQGLIRDAPTNAVFPFILGMIERDRGRAADARSAFRRSLELAPGNLMTLYQLVDVEIAATNAPGAMKLVQAELTRTNSAPLKYLEGRAFAAQRQWPQAEASLKQSLELNPQFSLSYQLLSEVYLANTNLTGAARELEELAAQKSNDLRSIMILGALYQRLDQLDKARDKYEQVLKISPQFVPALNNLAYVYTDLLPQLDRALELAQKARQLAPEDASVADTLGWVLHKRGEPQQALPLLAEAAQKNPASAEIQYHFGMASYMAGQPDAARTALQRAVASPDAFPGKSEAQRQLAALGGASGAVAAEDPAVLEKLVRDQPKDLTARSRLAVRYEQDGLLAKAAAEYEEILRQNPRAAPTALRLAQIYDGPLTNRSKAMDFARKARELAPNDPEPAALLGRLAFQSGDHAQAYALLQPAAQQLPRRADISFDFAWAAYSVGRVADADRAMRRVLEVEPGFKQADAARAFISMTTLAISPQGLAQAEPQILQVLKVDPNHAPALMAHAALLRGRGDGKAALALYERVLAKYPRFAPASRELGLLLAADPTQAQKAYGLLVKVREVSPDDAEVTRAMAMLSYQRQDYRYAITLLEGLVRGRPNDAEALYYLGMSLHQTKQTARGKEQLNQAVAAGLKDPLLAEAKKVLAADPGK